MGSLPAFKFISSVILAGLLFLAGAAADAIDGTWCKGARTFHIDGQIIRTPDGVLKKGDYDRHSFKYAGSPNDYWKEKIIQMDLTDDETLRLVPGENLASQIWRRCKPST